MSWTGSLSYFRLVLPFVTHSLLLLSKKLKIERRHIILLCYGVYQFSLYNRHTWGSYFIVFSFVHIYTSLSHKRDPLQIEVAVLSEVSDKQSVRTWCRIIDVSATTIHIWLCSRLLRRNADCDYLEHTSALGTSSSRGVSASYRLWRGLYEGVVNEARDTVWCVIE